MNSPDATTAVVRAPLAAIGDASSGARLLPQPAAGSYHPAVADGGGQVRVVLTGQLRLEVGDVVVDDTLLDGRQARLVVTYLLVERHRRVGRAELADLMWPGELPRSWDSALRNVLGRVRAFLSAAGLDAGRVLQTAHGSCQLELPAGAVVDLEVAGEALERSERLVREGDHAGAVAAGLVARAVFGRSFLPGEGGPWAESMQQQVEGWWRRAVLALGEARLGRGEPDVAAQDAEALIAVDPLSESAHRLAMRAQAALGNRAEALRAHERCRRVLVEEVGVGPSPETEALYLDLLRDEVEPQPAPAVAPPERRVHPPAPGGRVSRPDSHFVGRDTELRQVVDAWRAARQGHGRVVLLGGEAGIGKSRLAAEAAQVAATEGALVLHGRCDDQMPIPYQPFSEALGRYVLGADPAELRHHLGWGAGEVATLVASLRSLVPLPAAGPVDDADRSRLFEAVASFLRSLSGAAPLVVVLEDLHWASTATLLLLRHLVRASGDAAVLFIGTFRHDEIDPAGHLSDLLAHLRRERRAEELVLMGLDQAAVTALVHDAAVRPTPQLEAALAVRLVARTGGNPFFVGEVLRQLGDAHADGTDDAGVPAGVQDVVSSRFSRLSEGGRHLLRTASVVGEELEFSTLEALVGLGDEALLDALEEAVHANFLVEVPGDVGRYRFRHMLLRASVYAGISGLRRARLHGRVAAVLEEVGTTSSVEMAHHLVMAGERDRAFSHALEAAHEAMRSSDHEQAATLFELAVEVLRTHGDDDRRRLLALLGLGTALRRANLRDRARPAYLEAAALARRLEDPVALAEAALGLFGGATHGGTASDDDGGERSALLREALDALGSAGGGVRVRLLSALAYAHYFEPEARAAYATEAITSARRLDEPRAMVGALSAAWVASWGPRNTDVRLELAEEMVEVARRSGDDEREVSARMARLGDLFELGDRGRVGAEMAAVRDLVVRAPRPWLRWRVRAWDALLALVDGRFADAERLAMEALAVRGDPSDSNALQCFGIQLSCLRLVQGRSAEVVDLVADAAERYPLTPAYRCVRAVLLVDAGRLDEAAALFEDFAATGFAVTQDVNWITSMAALAETCAALGDRTRAEVLHRELEPVAHRMVVLDGFGGGAVFWGSVAHLVGILEATMGRRGDAERHLLQAVDANRRFGAVPWVERSERALASLGAAPHPR